MKKDAVKTVGLFGRHGDRQVGMVAAKLADFLRSRSLGVIWETATAALASEPVSETLPLDQIGARIDLAVVIGGDGTLLSIARHLAEYDVPLIGVNMGRLGFLTDVPTDRMLQVVRDVLDGDCQIEERLLLQAEIVRAGSVCHVSKAFNDVVVHKSGLARLIEFETYIDDDFVNGSRADGIIVATPTGSTAYALSAGGPILHPTLPAIVLVPISPHTLSNRPLAVNSDSHIDIVLVSNQSAHVTFDGQSSFSLEGGDRIRVRRADHPVTLVHPSDRNHYEVLRVKLRWGQKF